MPSRSTSRDYPAYVMTGGRFRDEKRITITTLQGMVNVYRDYSSGYFDLVITDECHRSIYGKWSGVLKHFDGVQLGLTATPCVVRPEVLDEPAGRRGQGVHPRHAALLRGRQADLPLHAPRRHQRRLPGPLPDLPGAHRQDRGRGRLRGPPGRTRLVRHGRGHPRRDGGAVRRDQDTITVDPSALERRFTIPERNRAIVREFRQVLEKGYTGRDGVRRAPMDGKTIVFAVTKRHAATLAQMLDAEFAHKKPSPEVRYADFVVSGVGGEEETIDGQTRIKRFKKEEFPRIMVSVNMLDTGFDFPEVVNLVMARFTKSAILYQQMRGRGARRADHIKKVAFTIFDFVGNVEFHGDTEENPEGGFVIAAKPPKEPPKPRTLLVLDVDDHIDPASRSWITLDDEGRPVRPPEVRPRATRPRDALRGLAPGAGGARARPGAPAADDRRADQGQRREDRELRALHRFLDPPFTYRGGLQRAESLFGGPTTEGYLADRAAVFGGRYRPGRS